MPAAELCDRPVTVEQVWGRPAITVWQNLGIDGFTVQGEYPIQVKRRDNVPRHVVDSFETAVERYGAARGLLIAFGIHERREGRGSKSSGVRRSRYRTHHDG
jgi:hypothetical protein